MKYMLSFTLKIHPRSYIRWIRRKAYIRQWKKDGMIDDSKPDPWGPYFGPNLGVQLYECSNVG